MKNFTKNKIIIFFGIILAIIFFANAFFYSSPSYAAVSLPWSTTYNCSDWTQGQTLSCDGISTYGDWTTSNGSKEQITAPANYPSGGGGKGQRHWLGDGYTNNSGGLTVNFSSPQSEIWMRWYMRFEQGFAWNYLNNYKLIYVNTGTSRVILGWDGSNYLRVRVDSTNQNYNNNINFPAGGWDAVMVNGGTYIQTSANGATPGQINQTSDGQWHIFEIHLKVDTNGTNGIIEWWVDQVKVTNVTNANLNAVPISVAVIGSNSTYPLNGRDMYVDYDDIAISTTGYIGPIVSGDTTAPTQPTNLAATVQSATQINLTWAASTDNVGVAGYNIYRDGVQIATSTTASYSDTGLTASTAYSYTVSAYDAAGNESAQSLSVSATTQNAANTTPPPPPPLKADFNSDSKVNDLDFTSFKNAFKSIFNSIFDLNTDSTIDVKDLGVLMNSWRL